MRGKEKMGEKKRKEKIDEGKSKKEIRKIMVKEGREREREERDKKMK